MEKNEWKWMHAPITKTDEVRNKRMAAVAADLQRMEKNSGVPLLTKVFSLSDINDMIVAGVLRR